MEKLKEFCKKLYDILEIFQNFEKNLKNLDQILKKFFEISLFAYSFQQTFQIIMYPVKIFWGRAPTPPVQQVKFSGGQAPSTDRLWRNVKSYLVAWGLLDPKIWGGAESGKESDFIITIIKQIHYRYCRIYIYLITQFLNENC